MNTEKVEESFEWKNNRNQYFATFAGCIRVTAQIFEKYLLK